jgi:hypothetical protein
VLLVYERGEDLVLIGELVLKTISRVDIEGVQSPQHWG